MGFQLTLEKVTERYGEGYELKPPAPIAPIQPSQKNSPTATEFAEPDDRLIDALSDQKVKAARLRMIHQIESLVDNSNDLVEFIEALPQIYQE
jgi:hypothetical protein